MLFRSSEFDRQEELSRTSSRSTTPFASGVEVLCKIRCTFCLVRLCRRCCGRGLAKRVTVCCCWWYCGERRRSLREQRESQSSQRAACLMYWQKTIESSKTRDRRERTQLRAERGSQSQPAWPWVSPVRPLPPLSQLPLIVLPYSHPTFNPLYSS